MSEAGASGRKEGKGAGCARSNFESCQYDSSTVSSSTIKGSSRGWEEGMEGKEGKEEKKERRKVKKKKPGDATSDFNNSSPLRPPFPPPQPFQLCIDAGSNL